jgi:hypothetical protein
VYDDLSVMTFLQTGILPSKADSSHAELKRIIKRANAYVWSDGQLFREPTPRYPRRRRVPTLDERVPLVTRLHTEMGHLGISKCVRLVTASYHWNTITSDVRDVVKSCESCQAEKAVFKLKSSLHPLPIPSFAFQSVSIDLMGPLQVTARAMSYVVLVVDRFSRWLEAAALPDKRSATIAKFFYENILARWGSPCVCLSDNAAELKHGEFAALLRAHGVRQVFTSARHAQANGLAERYIAHTMRSLRKCLDQNTSEWDLHLASVLRGHRFTVCASTRYSPIQMLCGHNARIATEQDLTDWNCMDTEVQTLAAAVDTIAADATTNMQVTQARQKADYDNRRPMDAGALPDPSSCARQEGARYESDQEM